jgi:hypothetical protein
MIIRYFRCGWSKCDRIDVDRADIRAAVYMAGLAEKRQFLAKSAGKYGAIVNELSEIIRREE